MGVEEYMGYMRDDEVLEVTPKSASRPRQDTGAKGGARKKFCQEEEMMRLLQLSFFQLHLYSWLQFYMSLCFIIAPIATLYCLQSSLFSLRNLLLCLRTRFFLRK